MLRSICKPKTSKCFARTLHRYYIQVPKLSFTNIEAKVPTKLLVKTAESSNLPTMSRIDLSKYRNRNIEAFTELKDHRKLIVRISELPSWYERLNSSSSYSILEDESLNEVPTLYRNFQRCYARVLASFTDTHLVLPKSRMKELQAKLQDQDLPENVQQQLVKVNVASRKFTELSSNTYTLYQRLKIKRMTPPFYIHQQFLINLGDVNVRRLLELYFELPEPRPLHLKREEFERFMRIILKLKISGDHRALLPKLVQFYDDIRKNGNGIQLTSFETTKYFSFLLNLWKEENLPMDIRYAKILQLKNLTGPKKLVFAPAMWNIFLSHFPYKVDDIMKLMANECGLTRSTAEIFIKHLKSLDSLSNTLELMKLKKLHLDPFLLDTIVGKYIEFGKADDAFELLIKIINTFEDISDMNWVLPSKSFQRVRIIQSDILNKTFQQMHNYDPEMKFSWLKYKFKPSPLTLGKLLLSLDTYNRYKLLKVMIQQNIPLVNKHALQIIEQRHLNSLPFVLKLVNQSKSFNQQLHHARNDVKYDAHYLGEFFNPENNPTIEMNEIFDKSILFYKQHENDENIDLIKSEIATELIKFDKYKAM